MRRLILLAALWLPTSAVADDWSALSNTAISITGDIKLMERKIVFDDGRTFKIKPTGVLSQDQLRAMGDITGARHLERASLFAIRIPASMKFRNGNTMCGRAAVTRMIVAERPEPSGLKLTLVFLSGAKTPFYRGWEEDADNGVCGSYSFVKWSGAQ